MPYGYGSANRRGPSGPGPGGQGARGQATQNPGSSGGPPGGGSGGQGGAMYYQAPAPTYQNVHQTGAVTQTPGRTVTPQGTGITGTGVVTTGGQSPFRYTAPTYGPVTTGGTGGIDKNLLMTLMSRKNKYDTGTLDNDFAKFSLDDLLGTDTDTDTDTDNMQLAKVYNTKDMIDLLDIKDKKTASKFVEDPVLGSPRFIAEKSWKDPLTQPQAMDKFHQNLKEQIKKHSEKTFEQQRDASFLGIRPKEKSLVPTNFLDVYEDVGNQKDFSDIAVEIEKKYPMAEGGRINRNMGGMASMQRQDVTPPGMELDLRVGGFIPIGAQEKADDVKARVSKNEFVFTADAVKAAGGGSVNEGAKRMYDTMKRLESQVA